ncbi:putative methyltransferase-domain-containing protein [Cytidiella melzeri]|nr:putative methyltransferase-domain-containing protein [Cytidiella melzeri]
MASDPNFPANLDIKPYRVSGDSFGFDEASQTETIRKYGIAGRVWEASHALKTYIEGAANLQFDPPFLQAGGVSSEFPVLLELGSGTGIVASALAQHLSGTRYTLFATDLPEVCPLLEKNLTRYTRKSSECAPHGQSVRSVFVRPLAWGNEEHALKLAEELPHSTSPYGDIAHTCYLTHIICSDLVYFPELLAPLLRTLIHVTSPPLAPPHGSGRAPKVVISYKIRSLSKETAFWAAFGLWFSFEPVLVRSRRSYEDGPRAAGWGGAVCWDAWTRLGSSDDSDAFVFVARRRSESLDWVMPPGDSELLDGVGARGSSDRKSDDTFEELLLMQLEA